jgi:uncharacterized protein YqjF (DUF2071 family)
MPALLRMDWRDLLFAHWPIPPGAITPLLPSGFAPDRFDGTAWIALVPFRMTRVRPLSVPLPGDAIAFPEVNVRTYVTLADGTPAVWFLSLDGAHRIGALAARTLFGVPYHDARIAFRRAGDTIEFEARRLRSRVPGEVRLRYRATGPARDLEPESFERFVSERRALVATRFGRQWRTDVDHAPWRLAPAEAEIGRNTLVAAAGLRLPDRAPVLHLAEDLVTVAHRPRLTLPPDRPDTGREGE